MSAGSDRLPSVRNEKLQIRTPFLMFVGVVQIILLAVHWFLYDTWVHFWYAPPDAPPAFLWPLIFALSFTFVAASVLSLQTGGAPVRWFYTFSAVWLGFASFAFYAAVACWISAGWEFMGDNSISGRPVAGTLFGLAGAATIYAFRNACRPRVRSFRIALPKLPSAWRGRIAAVVSDLHLGPVWTENLSRRVVTLLNGLGPDIVFIPGDFYDGTTANLPALAAPWRNLKAPHGAYFVAGNHEQFRYDKPYFDALQSAGVKVLRNEKIEIEGLQIAGVDFSDSAVPARYHQVIQQMHVDPERASVLLSHSPSRLGVPERHGISLQIAGHTHGGQFWPYTWITSRIFGRFVHGLHKVGRLQVLTTYGVGTWGPPLRLGAPPEIVLIQFE